jgi:hypothetical protein
MIALSASVSTSSEARCPTTAAGCLVKSCGLAQFPLPTPDAVHANVVLVAQRTGSLDRSGGMRNVRLLAATTSNAVLTIDKYNDFRMMAVNDARRMPEESVLPSRADGRVADAIPDLTYY